MLKKTKTRKRVEEILLSADTPLTANDIYTILHQEQITLSSIYRTLDTYTKEGIIAKENNIDGIAIYTLKQDDHHHFLECKNCHKKIKLDYCPYHQANSKIKKNNAFEVDETNVVYGTCKDCKK